MSCEKERQRAQNGLQNAENKGLSVGKMAQMRRKEHLDGGTLPVVCVAKIMRYITIYLYILIVIFILEVLHRLFGQIWYSRWEKNTEVRLTGPASMAWGSLR